MGKCLRVSIRVVATKKLVRGKRVTIEGGESRWVFFKYERLPNFCYQCGMLDQREKDCLEKMNMGKVKDVCNMECGLEVSQVDEGEEIKEEQEKRIGRKSNQAGRRWWRKRLHKKSSG